MEAETRALKRLFGVDGETEETLIAKLASVLGDDKIDAALAALAAFGSKAKTDKTAEANLRSAKARAGDRRVAAFADLFLTKEGKPGQIVTKGFATAEPALARTA